MAAARPARASREPTERSMPAVRITNVMPMATRPVMEIWRMTLKRLIEERKRGSRIANVTMRAMRKITGANWPMPRMRGRAASPRVFSTCVIDRRLASCRLSISYGHQMHENFLARACLAHFTGDAAGAHGQNTVADRQHLRQLGRNSNDGNAARRHAVQELVNLGFGADIDAPGRLIDDQYAGAESEPAGKHDL